MSGRGDLPQGARPIAALAITEYGRSSVGGSVQGEPVLGVLGRTPHLLAAFDRFATSVPHLFDTGPVTTGDQTVDKANESVEIARLDQYG
jgi:hypothetical protein